MSRQDSLGPPPHNEIVMVTGTPGCGKDYLLTRLLSSYSIPSSIATLSFGDLLLSSQLPGKLGIRDRDELRVRLSANELRATIDAVLLKLLQTQPLILNTHTMYTHQGFFQLDPRVDEILQAKAYIYIWAEPEQIALWRALDSRQGRLAEPPDRIALHQDMNLAVVRILANKVGASLNIVHNSPNGVDAAVAQINGVIRSVFT